MHVEGRKNEVYLCSGCTMQGSFLGKVSVEAADIYKDIPASATKLITAKFRFVDQDGGESISVIADSIDLSNKVTDAGSRGTRRPASQRLEIQQAVAESKDEIKVRMVDRVRRCEEPGVDPEGNQYCPALAAVALESLFINIVSSKLKS